MYKYQIDLYQKACQGVTIQLNDLSECREEVSAFISSIMEVCTIGKGFQKKGNIKRDNCLTIEHPAFGFEAGGYIKRLHHTSSGTILRSI